MLRALSFVFSNTPHWHRHTADKWACPAVTPYHYYCGLRRSLAEQGAAREQWQHVNTPRFDGLAATFFAIHQHETERDFSAVAFDGVDRLERGPAGGDDVIDDDHIVARFEVALDLFARAMALRLFADGENLQRLGRVFGGGGHADGEGNRVGTERHAADGVDLEVLGMDFRAHGMPAEIADEIGTERIERGDAAIDVEIALFAGGEGEGSGPDGFFEQEFFQGGGGGEHAGGFEMRSAGASADLPWARIVVDSPLVSRLSTRHAHGMESHEWFENTDEGKVYYRANYIGTRWTIMTTTQKRDPTWTDIKPVPEPIWRELRDLVWKKYQRKRCPWERVADLDRLLGDEPSPK